MDLELTEEQKMHKEMVRKLAEKEFKPLAAKHDAEGEFPRENIKKLAEVGLLGITIPEEYGGAGGDVFSLVIALEEIAKACASTAGVLLIHAGVASGAISHYGTPEQKERLLPDLVSGRKISAFAMTEPEAGSAATDLKTTAKPDGKNYIVNGRKCFISNAGCAQVYTVVTRFGDTPGAKGLGALIIEEGMEGFQIGKIEKKMGLCAFPSGELIFEDCRVPKENLLLGPGEFKKIMSAFNGERCGNSAVSLGIAEAAFEESLKYSQARKQFGRFISEFQGLQWMLADMKIKIEATSLLIYKALANAKGPFPSLLDASIAKTFANEMVIEVTNKALQIHGAYGYTKDYTVERLYRDARAWAIAGGTAQMQRNMIATQLLGRKVSQRIENL